MTLKKFIPDTAKEWHLIGRYIHQLGHMMNAVLLFAADKWWVLATLFITWIGGSAADYFGHQTGDFPEKSSNES